MVSGKSAEAWLNPTKTVRAVLCYISLGQEYLLLLKSKGRFGEGFWNAPGGKIEDDENAEIAARREVLEETGLELIELNEAGYLEFYFGEGKDRPDWTAVVFTSSKFRGEPILKETDSPSGEGKLKWFRMDQFPYDQMWHDDKYWLPLLFQGKKFHGVFVFSSDSKKLLSSKVTTTLT